MLDEINWNDVKWFKNKPIIKSIPKQTIIYPDIWRAFDIPQPIPEYQFTIERKWRIDYAWPIYKVAVEIEGGIWMKKSRHTSPSGYLKDMVKYNMLNEKEWALLRYAPKNINYQQIKRVIDNRIKA